MANSTLLFTLAYFFLHSSNETATMQNETALEIIGDWTANQQNTEDPFITSNPTDIIQDGKILATNQEIWCCKSGTTYLPGIDKCVPNFISTLYNESFPSYSYPNDGLADCPDGYVSHSTHDFQLDNGTLWVGGHQLKSNEFCINRVEEENYSTSSEFQHLGNFVARYCVPDPCTSNGCIRKCCPSDMALVTKYYHDLSPFSLCEPYPEKLNLSLLHSPQNKSIDEKSFFIRGGLGIKCGDVGVDSTPYDLSSFAMDRDGHILFYSVIDDPKGRKSDKYCVDNFVDNETNNIMALGCFPEQGEDAKGASFFGYLNLFATTFLIATLAVYSLLPKMRNIHGVILMCYLASMTVMYIFHAILMLVRGSDMPKGLCPTIAISLHFAYIATFSWLNVLCYGVWRMFSSIKPPTQRSVFGHQFLYYSIYGWGIPFIVVVVGQILQHSKVPDCIIKPGLNSNLFCWFNHKHRGPLIAYLYAPMIVMIGFNVVMFIWATFIFYRRSVETSKVTNISRKNQRFKVILSLFLLMGVPWTTEIITFLADSSFESALITDIFNIISPIFIFIIFICKPSVWKMLKLKYPRLNPVFTACEQMGSRIVHPKKSNRQPPASSEESQSNSNNNTTDCTSTGSTSKTDFESRSESKYLEQSSTHL